MAIARTACIRGREETELARSSRHKASPFLARVVDSSEQKRAGELVVLAWRAARAGLPFVTCPAAQPADSVGVADETSWLPLEWQGRPRVVVKRARHLVPGERWKRLDSFLLRQELATRCV
ncbi:hypothetical protein GUJ93_ZPchr0006g42638 [Zizania palustris]|uniref:Uncharacterized protein n=1 Tax=Zizania palustris TaxID=103762 RepID=A0A8J5SS91_ZIZPA|nr:hypothetical protein GUJ93_ZPchr0006g42638 [Zizania palustris]